MSRQDKQRWDQRWREMAREPFSAHPLLTSNEALLTGGRALDLACGLGQNAIFLAGHGYEVLGIDISGVALKKASHLARKSDLSDQVVFAQMDLDKLSLPVRTFDMICVFRFLNRRLFSEIRRGLKPGGLLFYSTRHVGLLERQPWANKEFLLQPGELFREYCDLEIVYYEEGPENAQIIARAE